jgi:hypothetical protein
VYVTNRRTLFVCGEFEKGGGWVGFGLAGVAVALTANVISKRKAANRSAGKIAIGHIRHEWVTGVVLKQRKSLIGIVDIYVDLIVATTAGLVTVELWAGM